ncbi:MAG TPA: heparan-alpha-glucosaminide N-acetyltransferase domain-containing protein, partial [Armatimonadota bacterium]
FLLAVGIAIPFSVASFRKTGQPGWRFTLRVLRRAAVLVAIGCLLVSLDRGYPLVSLGVLQLIGIDYFLGALLYRIPWQGRVALSALLLIAYWAALKFIPVPGLGVGVLEEGRNLIEYWNHTSLAAFRVGGLPVIAPTTALVLIGTLLGDLFRAKIDRRRTVGWLLAGGAATTGLSLIWSLHLAFNKPLWTSPFILFSAGAGAVLLGLLYITLDIKGWRAWAFPFAVFGANALLAYILPTGIKYTVVRALSVTFNGGITLTRGWVGTSIYLVLWWVVCWVLYRKKWFIRV